MLLQRRTVWIAGQDHVSRKRNSVDAVSAFEIADANDVVLAGAALEGGRHGAFRWQESDQRKKRATAGSGGSGQYVACHSASRRLRLNSFRSKSAGLLPDREPFRWLPLLPLVYCHRRPEQESAETSVAYGAILEGRRGS